MAGEPAPLASVQAAVMKSAAGAAAQAPPSMASQFQTNAIASDLNVMADQAGSYARRTAEGNAEAQSNRAAAAARLQQEAAQAAQERANSLELQRMDLAASKARMAADATSAQMGLASDKAAAGAEDDMLKFEQGRDAVLGEAARRQSPTFLSELNEVVESSGSMRDALRLFDNMAQRGEYVSSRGAMERYLREIYQRAGQGKAPRLGKNLDKPGENAEWEGRASAAKAASPGTQWYASPGRSLRG